MKNRRAAFPAAKIRIGNNANNMNVNSIMINNTSSGNHDDSDNDDNDNNSYDNNLIYYHNKAKVNRIIRNNSNNSIKNNPTGEQTFYKLKTNTTSASTNNKFNKYDNNKSSDSKNSSNSNNLEFKIRSTKNNGIVTFPDSYVPREKRHINNENNSDHNHSSKSKAMVATFDKMKEKWPKSLRMWLNNTSNNDSLDVDEDANNIRNNKDSKEILASCLESNGSRRVIHIATSVYNKNDSNDSNEYKTPSSSGKQRSSQQIHLSKFVYSTIDRNYKNRFVRHFLSFREWASSFLLPDGYPLTVTPTFEPYMRWRAVQYFFGGALGVFTTRSLMASLGEQIIPKVFAVTMIKLLSS